MDADMDLLLAQDMLSFTPLSGSFDVEAVAAGLAGIDFCYRDTARPERFCLVPEAGWRDNIAAARAADPKSPFPRACNLEVHADEVMVWPAASQPGLAAVSRQVLGWLLANYDCAIENDLGTDLLAPGA